MRKDPVNGVIIFDPRLVDDENLTVNTGATLTSSYSEAGSVPNVVTKVDNQTLTPVITGAMSDDTLTLRVNNSGLAGQAGISYSTNGGTTRTGWQAPVTMSGWQPIDWSNTAIYECYSAVTIESTQTLMVAYSEYGTGSVYLAIRDNTGVWTKSTITSVSARALCLLVTPDESMLILVQANTSNQLLTRYSIDGGTTWVSHASAATINVTLPSACSRMTGCYIGNNIIIFPGDPGGAGDTYHYASADHGISFEYIETFTYANAYTHLKVSPLRVGGLVTYNYWNTTDVAFTDVKYTIYADAFDELGTEYELYRDASQNPDNVTSCCDSDGIIYLLVNYPDGTAYIWSNNLDGAEDNWSPAITTVGTKVYQTGDSLTHMTNTQLVARGGELRLFGNHSGNPGSYDGSLSVFKLSEWSNIEIVGTPKHCYVPFDVPTDIGGSWSFTGTSAGTIATTGYLNFTTTAAQGYYQYTGATTSITPFARFSMREVSGGSLTNADIATGLFACNGSASYQMRIRITSTGFMVFDSIASATVVDVSYTMTSDTEILMGFTAAGVGYVAYKREYENNWTIEPTATGHAFTAGASSTNWLFSFGAISAGGTAQSQWKYVMLYSSLDSIVSGTSLSGKVLNNKPYPLPLTDTDGYVEFISVKSGMGLNTQEYEIEPNYTYSLKNIFPSMSPSPSKVWRSLDDSQQVLTFSLTERTYLGGGLAVTVLNSNIKTMYLDYYDGAAWQTGATYDATIGLYNLEFDRVGNVIYPNAGTDDSLRMIGANELVGCWADISGKPRTILSNTGGDWTDVTTARPHIILDGIDGTEPASDPVNIVHKNGIFFWYPTTPIRYRYWRIRIPNQTTPDGYFQAGLIGIGQVIPFGQPINWGWTESIDPNNESFSNRVGSETRHKLGDAKRTITFNFADGLSQENVRGFGSTAGFTADYIATSTGTPLEIVNSNLHQLKGVLESTDQFSIPSVLVLDLPTSDTTLTDPSLFLYGYLDGNISSTMVSGTEGVNEVLRIDSLKCVGII